tara:strand:+ start:15117 stop:16526 length:1410 start_codon:yes stop_codon:yes gene_type:complete
LRKILISETLDEIRVAVVDNSRLRNFFIDNNREQISIRGNIYKAKRNLNANGIEASFVDIGLGKSAFLSKNNPLKEEVGEEDFKVQEISKDDFIMVQGISDYDPRKAPKVSDFITLPSKFCVVLSKPGFLGISKRIDDEKKRTRLKSLKKMTNRNIGIILRTSCGNQTLKEIKQDISKTKKKWKEIMSSFKTNYSVGLLHQEDNIIDGIFREFLNNDTKEIEFDSRKIYSYFRKKLNKNKSEIKLKITNKKDEIFSKNRIDKEIEKIFHKKLNLKNGSFLLIEEKEGLTVIDVNSGRSLNNRKESNFTVNIGAAEEIARQIILRNLSGIILIDFIDLHKSKEKKKLFNVFKNAMKQDKSKHTILPISKFGIIEMTRQKIGTRTTSLVSESCAHCFGSGLVTRKELVCYQLIREIVRTSKQKKNKININLNSGYIDTMHSIIDINKSNKDIKDLEIKIKQDDSIEKYKII